MDSEAEDRLSRYRLSVFPLLAVTALAACAPASRPPQERAYTSQLLIQVRLASLSPVPGYLLLREPRDGAPVYVSEVNVVDDQHVTRVQIHRGSSPELIISVWFTPEGGARLYAATSTAIGQYGAVFIGGRLASVAVIVGAIGSDIDVPTAMGIDVDVRTADELAARIASKWPLAAPE